MGHPLPIRGQLHAALRKILLPPPCRPVSAHSALRPCPTTSLQHARCRPAITPPPLARSPPSRGPHLRLSSLIQRRLAAWAWSALHQTDRAPATNQRLLRSIWGAAAHHVSAKAFFRPVLPEFPQPCVHPLLPTIPFPARHLLGHNPPTRAASEFLPVTDQGGN